MKTSKLLTLNGLELPCVILPVESQSKEVIVYCQNRLVKGYINNKLINEIEVIIDWCVIPELDELLYEL